MLEKSRKAKGKAKAIQKMIMEVSFEVAFNKGQGYDGKRNLAHNGSQETYVPYNGLALC